MKKEKCILVGGEVFLTIIGIMCLVLSNPFYEVLITFIQKENGSLEELFKNSVGVISSLILGLSFIWTVIVILIRGEKKYLKKDEKKTIITSFFNINIMPILMIFFSIFFFEKCFILSTLFLFIIGIYSSAAILVSIIISWFILCVILKEYN